MTLNSGLGATSIETAFTLRKVAQAADIDELNHVNNAVYVRWIQEISVTHWFHVAPEPMATEFIWVCRRHEIDYHQAVKEGQEVVLSTWLGARRGATFDRHTDIRFEGAARPAVTATTAWAMLDKSTFRPRRVGQDVLDAFGLHPPHDGE